MSDYELKSYNALDFSMKFSLHVRYCIEKKTIQFLNSRFSVCRIWKKFAYKKSRFLLLLRVYDNFCVSRAFFRSYFWKQILTTRHILKWKEYNASKFELTEKNASDSDLKNLQLVRFWIESLTTCQISNWKNYHKSVFELKKNTTRQILNWRKLLVRFWNLKNAQSVRVWNKILLEVRCRIGKLQRIRCWKKFFTRQILHFVVKKNEPDFEFEMFRHLGFQKSLHTKIELLFLLHENDIFAIFVLFLK